jgi:hypothetical protein
VKELPMSRCLVTSGAVSILALAGCAGTRSQLEAKASSAAVGHALETLLCSSRNYYFNAGDGTYEITLNNLDPGNKRYAEVCVEGDSHQCRVLINRGQLAWDRKTPWIVNLFGRNHIQIWQSEDDYGGAMGASDGPCAENNKVSVARLLSTHGFDATLLVTRK